MFGLALYVGEGGKTNPHAITLSNCDPGVIRFTLKWLRFLGTDVHRIKGQIHIHDARGVGDATAYWVKQTGLPEDQFTTAIVATSKASQRKKGNLRPFGTLRIQIGDTPTRQKIERWMKLALMV